MIKTSYVYLTLLTILSFLVSYYGPPYFPVIYFLLWFGVLLLSGVKQATIFYLIIMLVEGDISKYGLLEEANFNTVYTTYVLGRSLSLIWTVVSFLLVALVYFKRKNFRVDRYIFPFLLLLLISVSMSVTNDSFSINIFISDLGYFINLFTGYLAANLFISTRNDIQKFFKYIVVIIVCKSLIVIVDSVAMNLVGFFNTYAVGTGAYLFPLAISYLFLTLSNNKAIKLFSLSSIFIFLIVSASRGRLLIAGASLLLSSYAARKKKAVIFLFATLPLIVIGINVWNPDTANYFLWKVATFIPNEADSTGKVASMSSLVRVIELYNILSLHLDKKYTLLFGTGLSGYFNADYISYPFNLYGSDSYPDEWISANTFYKPHGSLLYILLKFGLIGFVLIFGTIISLVRKIISLARNVNMDKEFNYILISIASFIPFLFIVNFSSKLQIFGGVVLGILSSCIKPGGA